MLINPVGPRGHFLGVFVIVGIYSSTANAQSAIMAASGGLRW